MRRRAFIVGIGTAAAWPLVTRAQQPDRIRRVGVLMNLAADDPEAQRRTAAFSQALRQFDWIDGRNVQIEYRWGSGDAGLFRKYAAELVAMSPDVILATGTPVMDALQQATRTVPIVFVTVIDPVGAGFVESLARPGGNATGFTLFEYGMSGKWLELLKEIAPNLKRVAVLRDAARISTGQLAAIQAVAPLFGVELSPIGVRDPAEIERAVTGFASTPGGRLIVTASTLPRSIVTGSLHWRSASIAGRLRRSRFRCGGRPGFLWPDQVILSGAPPITSNASCAERDLRICRFAPTNTS